MNKYIVKLLLPAICTALISPSVMALSTDRDQPAQISADDIEFDFNTGVRTYTGNVTIVQGTLRITADKLVANYDAEGELSDATAWGNLASFQQRPDDKDTDTIGKGREIFLDQVANTLTLITTASLTQGPNTATGARIIYDMATDKLRIQGGGGAASINTAGKDGSTLPAAPPVAPEEPATPTAAGDTEAKKEECVEGESDCEKSILQAAIPGVDVSVSPSGRSRVIIQPSSNPAPATTAKVNDIADDVESKVKEAIEDNPEAAKEIGEKVEDAVESGAEPTGEP